MSYPVVLTEWWRGFFYFATFFLLHVIWWRTQRPKKEFYSLLLLLLALPSSIYGASALLGWVGAQWLPAFLLHVFLASNYIAIYPAIAAQSPTITLLYGLGLNDRGLTEEEALGLIKKDAVLEDRIQDLERSKMIYQKEGHWKLSKKANLLAVFFTAYRSILAEEPGKG